MDRYSVSPTSREIELETTVNSVITPVRVVIVKKARHYGRQRCGELEHRMSPTTMQNSKAYVENNVDVSRLLNKLPDDLAILLIVYVQMILHHLDREEIPVKWSPRTSSAGARIQWLLSTANSTKTGRYCFFPKCPAVLSHNYLSVHKKSMFFFLFLWKTIQRRKQSINAFKILTRATDAVEMAQGEVWIV